MFCKENFSPLYFHIISSGLADLLAERQAGAGGQRRDLRLRNHVVRRQQSALPAEGMVGNSKFELFLELTVH